VEPSRRLDRAPVRCFKRRRTSPESASVNSTIPDPPDDVPVYHWMDDDYSEGSSSPDITEQSRPPQTLDSPMHALALPAVPTIAHFGDPAASRRQ
jgi:hypothetical protein